MRLLPIGFTLAVAACGQDDGTIGSSQAGLETWTTIVNTSGVGLGAQYKAAVARNSNMIVIGGQHLTSDGGAAWVVRHTTDGTSFVNDDTYQYASGAGGSVAHLAVDATGRVFATGWVDVINGGTGTSHTLTRMSASGTGGYINVDDVLLPANTIVQNQSSAFYNGVVYAFSNWESNYVYTAHIRYSSNGTTWFDLAPPANVLIQGMCSTQLGVMVVGTTGTGAAQDWVAYATNDHATWTLYDNFGHTSSSYAVPHACAQVGTNLYVVGAYHDTQWSWVVRQGNSAGNGWTIVDTYTSDAGWYPTAVGPGASTRVLVTGDSTSATEEPHWHTRSRTGFGNWIESDDWEPNNAFTGYPMANDYAYASALGSYVVGTSKGNAIVRRLAP